MKKSDYDLTDKQTVRAVILAVRFIDSRALEVSAQGWGLIEKLSRVQSTRVCQKASPNHSQHSRLTLSLKYSCFFSPKIHSHNCAYSEM